MSSLLATKLHRPSVPPKRVPRPHLIQRLNEGLASGRQLTLVSAPAGFGKTTCISEWANALELPVTWPAMPGADKYRPFVADFMQLVRALVKPVSEGHFAGALDISKVPSFRDRLKFRLSIVFGVWSEGDHRDWKAICAWAESIRSLLLQ